MKSWKHGVNRMGFRTQLPAGYRYVIFERIFRKANLKKLSLLCYWTVNCY